MIHTYRGYLIKPHPQFPVSFTVATEGRGGKIPDMLSGLFTSLGTVKNAVDQYLLTKPKGIKNDEEGK